MPITYGHPTSSPIRKRKVFDHPTDTGREIWVRDDRDAQGRSSTRDPSPTVNAVTGAALFSGGGGSTGGGGSSTASRPEPQRRLEGFQLDEIEAALEAINARFGREKQQLENQRGSVRRAFEMLSQNLGEEQARQVDLSREKAAGGGRIKSGLFLEEQADIADMFADRRTRARADRSQRLTAIEQALATIEARREREREMKARGLGREVLGTQEAIAQALQLV